MDDLAQHLVTRFEDQSHNSFSSRDCNIPENDCTIEVNQTETKAALCDIFTEDTGRGEIQNVGNDVKEEAEPTDVSNSRQTFASRSTRDFIWGEKLGAGVFGTVFAATPRHSAAASGIFLKRQDVAIKRVSISDGRLQRARKESRTHASLSGHPSIATHHSGFKEGNFYYMVMERLRGGTLLDESRGNPLPEHNVMAIMLQIFDALSFMHNSGVAHLDLKSSNVVLTEPLHSECQNVSVKIVDFGLSARYVCPFDISRSVTKGRRGTVAYMAPELSLKGKAFRASAADVWAAGAMMFELLTGRLPICRQRSPSFKKFALWNEAPHITNWHLLNLVSPDIRKIVISCLQFRAVHRSSASDVRRDIKDILYVYAFLSRCRAL